MTMMMGLMVCLVYVVSVVSLPLLINGGGGWGTVVMVNNSKEHFKSRVLVFYCRLSFISSASIPGYFYSIGVQDKFNLTGYGCAGDL